MLFSVFVVFPFSKAKKQEREGNVTFRVMEGHLVVAS